MSQQNEDLGRRRKRTQWALGQSGVFFLCMGGLSLFSVLDNPRVAALHVTDILKLTGGGATIALGLVLLLGFFGRFPFGPPRESRTETPPSPVADRQAMK